MPRQSRIDAPGALHHIIIRGIEQNKIFVDNKDYLVRKNELANETQMGQIKIELFPGDYKKLDKMFVPTVQRVKQLGMTMEIKLIEQKVNVKLKGSEFNKPQPATSVKPPVKSE